MVLTERQWRDIKRIKWSDAESRRIRERVHDNKIIVGWCGKEKRWMLARVVSATVHMKYGAKTIATSEQAPFIWKRWETDEGTPLHIRDPRLIPYIQRCDLWRQGGQKYMLQFDHAEWIEETKEKSDGDELEYAAKQAFDRIKPLAKNKVGYIPKHPVSTKWFGPTSWR